MANLSRRFLVCAAASLSLAKTAQAGEANIKPVSTSLSLSRFGVALPLNGVYGLQGDEVWRGIQLAVEDINAHGGIAGAPISLAVANMPTQAGAAAAVNQLLTANKASILLGSGSSALSYPASAAAELAQVPFIELTAPADGIMQRGFKFLLRTGPDTSMIGQLAASTLKERYAGRRVGLLFNTGATAGAVAASALNELKAAKLPVTLAIAYPGDTDNLLAQAGRLMRAGVEVLLHAAGPDDTLLFFQAMRSLGWRPAVLIGCGEGYKLRDTQVALGSVLDGTLVIAAPFYPGQAAVLASSYAAKFGVPPRSADSCTAYVGAKLVFDTLNAVQGDPSKLLASLRQLRLPQGALANGFGVHFDATGQNLASFVTLQSWRNGVLTPA